MLLWTTSPLPSSPWFLLTRCSRSRHPRLGAHPTCEGEALPAALALAASLSTWLVFPLQASTCVFVPLGFLTPWESSLYFPGDTTRVH